MSATQFKIGDRVRIVRLVQTDLAFTGDRCLNMEGTVQSFDGSRIYRIHLDRPARTNFQGVELDVVPMMGKQLELLP